MANGFPMLLDSIPEAKTAALFLSLDQEHNVHSKGAS
jgi:hypothetical protein